MSIIYSYPEETSLQGSDMLIGTSTALVGGKQKNITKNFTLAQLTSFIQGGEGVINPAATDFQIAVFNQSGSKITGSIMSQDVYPNGTGITITGNLSATGNLTAPGTVTLGGGSNLIDLRSTTKFSGPIQDSNGLSGSVNQILLSNISGELVWGNYTAGLTYQGLWNAATNSPGLSSSVGVNSTFYIVGTAGNTVLNGNTNWEVGDWAIFVGTTGAGGIWQKIDNTSSITGNGTLNRMVMWSSNFTVTDGPLLDNSATNVLSILNRSILPSVSNTRDLGSAALRWNMLYSNDIETTNINVLNHIDLAGLPGTPGQVFTSGGVGAPATWTTPTVGTITGTGQDTKIPVWTNSTVIGTSILTQLNAATPFTDTYLSVGSGGVSTTGLKVDGFFVDSTGSKGTAGQILSSTGTATLWKTGEDSSVTYSLAAGAQDGSSVPINLTDSLSVTTPVKLTGGTNVDVVRTSATEITLSSTDTNTTYDFGSSTDGLNVLLNLVGTPTDDSSVKLIGSGVTITQAADEVTFTVPAGDTYELNAGVKSGTSVPLNLTSGSGNDNSVVNLTEGTGITLTQTSATEITIAGVAQGVTGSGTVNKLPKFSTTTSLTDSLVSEVPAGSPSSYTADNAFFVEPIPQFLIMGVPRRIRWLRNQDINAFPTLTFPPNSVAGTAVFTLTGDIILDADSTNVITAGTYNVDFIAGVSGGVWNSVELTFSESDWLQAPGVAGNVSYANSGAVTSLVATIGAVTDAEIEIAAKLDVTNHKIINVTNPTDAQDAATKSYVDTVVTGQLVFEGDYDATTAPPFGLSVLQGYTYVVTVAGDYGGLWPIPLAVGDLIIANQDNPVDVGDYTEVNKQVDIASETTLGIANFPTGNSGLNVTNGAVTAKLFSGTLPGYVPDATSAPTGTFLKEDGTWAVAGTGTVTGTGVENYVTKWSAGGVGIENSTIFDSGTNVGIGTASPSAKLHQHVTDSSINYHRFTNSDTGVANTDGFIVGIGETEHAVIWNYEAKDLIFGTNGVERLRIKSNGNVGIGTDSPGAKLDVNGISRITGSLAGTGQSPLLQFYNTDGAVGVDQILGTIDFYQSDPGGGGVGVVSSIRSLNENPFEGQAGLLFYTGTASTLTEKMRINSSGNVGIGTTSPSRSITVNSGDQQISALIESTSSISSQINIKNSSSTNGGFIKTTGDNIILTANNPGLSHLVVADGGNVGIGTSSPVVSLDISATDAVKIPVGTTTQRDAITPAAGMFRYNSTLGEFEGYTTEWGSIGGGGASATITTASHSGDGSTLTFALGATPNGSSVNFVDAYIDGVYQETSTYTVSGTNIVFNAGNAPAVGTNLQTKTTSDYNVGAAVQTVSLGQSNETGNVNLRIAPVEVLSATTPTAAANHLYIFTATSGTPSTLTLPSNPVSGDSIKISNIGGLANVITPSGTDKIMGVAGSMTIDNPTAAFEMIWSGITAQGWIIIGNV